MRQFLLPREFNYTDLIKGKRDEDSPEVSLDIRGRDFHYLVHVLRHRPGTVFNGIDQDGNQYTLSILTIGPEKLTLLARPVEPVSQSLSAQNESRPEYYLFQALLKGKKMDTVIRQASETGIHHIVPLLTEHTVVKLESPAREEKKLDRWNTIIGEAQQQSGSTVHPKLHAPVPIRGIRRIWQQESLKSAVSLFFHQTPLENGSLHRYLSSCPRKVALVIGPEGGLSVAETEYLCSCGFFPVHLQTNVLRAETAAIYAIGAVQSILQEKEKWQIFPAIQQEPDIAE